MQNIKIQPPKTNKKRIIKIMSRMLFPPFLIWDATHYVINNLLGKIISEYMILPAQRDYTYDANDINNRISAINASQGFTATQFTVESDTNIKLHTFEIKQTKSIPSSDQKYLINFIGNGMHFEDIFNEMQNDAQELDCNVIGFNLRGVNLSSGKATCADHLITDGIAQVQRLLNEGVSPENITLKGHSLGGALASLVAKYFYDQGIKINVFNSRSFSTITNFIIGHVRSGNNGHYETFGKKLLGWIVKPFVKLGVALSGWDMNSGDAFKALPASHKEYMVVRSSKSTRNELKRKLKDDGVITHYASIHMALKQERKKEKAKLKKAIHQIESMQNASLLEAKLKEEAITHLNDAKKRFNERKMTTGKSNHSTNGHVASMENLKDRYQEKSANVFFQQFFKRTHNHHENAKQLSQKQKNKM